MTVGLEAEVTPRGQLVQRYSLCEAQHERTAFGSVRRPSRGPHLGWTWWHWRAGCRRREQVAAREACVKWVERGYW